MTGFAERNPGRAVHRVKADAALDSCIPSLRSCMGSSKLRLLRILARIVASSSRRTTF